MNKELETLCYMINGTSVWEMEKWAYELCEDLEIMTLCDVRREIEKITWKTFSTYDILLAMKNSWWIIMKRYEDGRYDLIHVDIKKLISYLSE